MKLYTKGGDKGYTSLIGGERVPKTDPRVEAYGTVDELTAHIALLADRLSARCAELSATVVPDIKRINSALMTVEALLAAQIAEKLLSLIIIYLPRNIDRCVLMVRRNKLCKNSFFSPHGSIARIFLRELDDLTGPNPSIRGDDCPVGIAYITPLAVCTVEFGRDAHKGIPLFNGICFRHDAFLLF